MIRILVSACLLGEAVRYDGEGFPPTDDRLLRWQREGRLVRICPEVAGGLTVPRPPAEIVGGTGNDVWQGHAEVVTKTGAPISAAFRQGAKAALTTALSGGARLAILKARSPSCGIGHIYDGQFSGRLRQGDGVTAAYLLHHGIAVYSEEQLDEAAAHLARLEADSLA